MSVCFVCLLVLKSSTQSADYCCDVSLPRWVLCMHSMNGVKEDRIKWGSFVTINSELFNEMVKWYTIAFAYVYFWEFAVFD